MLLFCGLLLLIALCESGLCILEPGKISKEVTVNRSGTLFATHRSAYNGTQIEIRVNCIKSSIDSKDKFHLRLVARSSPCDREFPDLLAGSSLTDGIGSTLLNDYFAHPTDAFKEFGYNYLYYLKSENPYVVDCSKDHAGKLAFVELNNATWEYSKANFLPTATQPAPAHIEGLMQQRARRSGQESSFNNASIAKDSLRTSHAALRVPALAIYLLMFSIVPIVPSDADWSDDGTHGIALEISWKFGGGYLSAIDWPLLPFFGAMSVVYSCFAIAWLIVSILQWKDLLRIQFWIGGVVILGMLEAAVFYAEYQSVNSLGQSVEGALEFAEIISCLKRTLARMLIIIVAVGFGVVKPRLGSTLHKVVSVGFIYFILSAIESIMRVSKAQHENLKQKQLIALPLTAVDIGICWWIFTSLVNTMRTLRLRRNEVKLSLYRHFTNTLIFAVLASVVFMAWSLYMHTFTPCLKDWMELWVDTAFWHLLFCVILLVIVILWRPTMNNQRYAFTPLLDSIEDEDEEDVVYGEGFTKDAMKLRAGNVTSAKRRSGERNTSLDEELRWIDENIPSSLADKALPALIDSDEEVKQARFEISKMQ